MESTQRLYRHPVMGEEYHGDWSYCLACEVAVATARVHDNDWQCPYCGASAMDIAAWDKTQHPFKGYPEYPDVPEEGKKYPMPPEGHPFLTRSRK